MQAASSGRRPPPAPPPSAPCSPAARDGDSGEEEEEEGGRRRDRDSPDPLSPAPAAAREEAGEDAKPRLAPVQHLGREQRHGCRREPPPSPLPARAPLPAPASPTCCGPSLSRAPRSRWPRALAPEPGGVRLPRRHRPSVSAPASLLKLRGCGEERGGGRAAKRQHFWTCCCSAKVHPLGRVKSAQGSEKKRASSQVWCRLCVAAVWLTTSFLETCPSAPLEIHPCCSTVPLPNLCGHPPPRFHFPSTRLPLALAADTVPQQQLGWENSASHTHEL